MKQERRRVVGKTLHGHEAAVAAVQASQRRPEAGREEKERKG
jgi:hypothetical protein